MSVCVDLKEFLCYLIGHRFHFAFLLEVLFVGPQEDAELLVPPTGQTETGERRRL